MINDIINEQWQGHSHGEVEAALKLILQQILNDLEQGVEDGSIGREQLTQALKDAIDSIASKVPNDRRVNGKQLNADVTIGTGDIKVGNTNKTLTALLDEMQEDIEHAGGGVTQQDIDDAIAALVDGAPETLDTLKELATALDNTPNAITALTNLIDTKQDTLVAGNGIAIAQDGKTVSVAEAIRTGAGKGATAVQSVSVNDVPVTPDGNGNINIEVQSGGETVVINSDGANIVDSHTNNSVLVAGSARQVKMLYDNLMEVFNKLGNYAFPNGKPTLDWVGSIDKFSLSYYALNGCSTDTPAGQVSEGQIQIKLTPNNADAAFTVVQVNGADADWEFTGDNDGSIFVNIMVNQDIIVAATAVVGFNVSLGGASSNVRLMNTAAILNETYRGKIVADDHYDLPSGINAFMNGVSVDFSASGNSYSQATGDIEIANVTGAIVIIAQASLQSHLTLTLPNDAHIICKHGEDILGTQVDVYSGMMPYIVSIEAAPNYRFVNVPSVGGSALTRTGKKSYALLIATGSTEDITVTASVEAVQTYDVELPDDAHITSQLTDADGYSLGTKVDAGDSIRIMLTPAEGYTMSVGGVTMGADTLAEGTDYTLTMNGDTATIAITQVTGDISIAATSRMVNTIFKGIRYGDTANNAATLNYLYVGKYEDMAVSQLIDINGLASVKFFAGSATASSNHAILFFDANGKTMSKVLQGTSSAKTVEVPSGAYYARVQFPKSLLTGSTDVYVTDADDTDLWRLSEYDGPIGEDTDFLSSPYNPYPARADGSYIGYAIALANRAWNGHTNQDAIGSWQYKMTMVCKPGKSGETRLGYGVSPMVTPASAPSAVNIYSTARIPEDVTQKGALYAAKANGLVDWWLQAKASRDITDVPNDVAEMCLLFVADDDYEQQTYYFKINNVKVWEFIHNN